MSKQLQDKVAIVTGASSGLGARFARVLSAAGSTGFRPEGAELVISGLCSACAASG